MWSLNIERLKVHAPAGLGDVAIETGTCRGNGARLLAKYFPRVISIELSEQLFELARERLKPLQHVECLRGSSVEMLGEILPALRTSTFIFLDAHWSGDSSVNWKPGCWQGYGMDTVHLGVPGTRPSSREQCPLAEELRVIVSKSLGSTWILIDDMKNIPRFGPGACDQGFPGEDWSHLSREYLLRMVESRLEKLVELEDPSQWLLQLRPVDELA